MLTVFGCSPILPDPCGGVPLSFLYQRRSVYLAYWSSQDRMIETIDCVLGGNMLRRMLVAQCGVTALLALALWLFGPNLLHSALLGAGIGVAGNGYAAWRVFAGSRSKNGSVAMFELYRAEFGKLVIIGVLCGCAFIALEDLNFAAFLGGLVSVTLASVVAAATHTVELPEQLGRQI